MPFAHETINDDKQMQLYFSLVEASGQLVPLHWHNHLEILYLSEGSMTANINESSYSLNPGDILLVNPKDLHYTQVYGDCRYYLLQIPSEHLERISSDWKLLHFQEYFPCSSKADSQNRKLSAIIEEMIRLDSEKEPGYHLLFLIQIYQFLYFLYTKGSTRLSRKSRSQTDRDFHRIEQSMQYVKINFRSPISLSDVAGQLSLTPEYFCRLFKKYTGQTFFTYVNQVRLLHFYQELLHTDDSITYLLDKNGITNYKLFMREFKEAYGTTPHRLRKQHQTNDK